MELDNVLNIVGRLLSSAFGYTSHPTIRIAMKHLTKFRYSMRTYNHNITHPWGVYQHLRTTAQLSLIPSNMILNITIDNTIYTLIFIDPSLIPTPRTIQSFLNSSSSPSSFRHEYANCEDKIQRLVIVTTLLSIRTTTY